MLKFKKDDKIRCIRASGSRMKLGETYTVLKSYKDCYGKIYVRLVGQMVDGGWDEDRFELVPKSEVTLEVGKRYLNKVSGEMIVTCKYVSDHFVVFSSASGKEFGITMENAKQFYTEHKEKIVRYLNIYTHDGMYRTRAEADEAAGDNVRVACLRIEGEAGQFDQ